jgi:hypothetical protein
VLPSNFNFDSNFNVNKKLCTLIITEARFCKDLGCDGKLTKKIEKYSPLISAPEKYWGRMEFVTVPIGHMGTTLRKTLEHLIIALFSVRPHLEIMSGAAPGPSAIKLSRASCGST